MPKLNRRSFISRSIKFIAGIMSSISFARTSNARSADKAPEHSLPETKISNAPTGLMCCLLAKPQNLVIPTLKPTFTWEVPLSVKGAMQEAYQIQILDPTAPQSVNGVVADSGKIVSNESVAVSLAGVDLKPGQTYRWRVRISSGGVESDWSTEQEFLLGDADPHTTTARFPVVLTPISPKSIATTKRGSTLVDFGQDAFGALLLTFQAPASGVAKIHIGEALDENGSVNRAPGGSVRYLAADVPFDSSGQPIEVPLTENDKRLMAADIGAVMPFRYVEIEDLPTGVTLSSCTQHMAHYPFDDRASSFSSSSSELGSIWDLCKHTMKATSFGGVFVDGDRERHPYEADDYINQLGWYYNNREFTLPRYSQEYLIKNPTWPTEWIMHSVMMAWTDYLYTGDSTSLSAYYGDLKAKTLVCLARADGLISTSHLPSGLADEIHIGKIRDIVDWPAVERDSYDMGPVNTVVNAFHYHALLLMANISDALQRNDDASSFRQQAAQVYGSFNSVFYAPTSGLYVDAENSEHSSLHANMFALAFGLVPVEYRPAVADFVRSKGMACSVYGAQYLLEACYQYDLDDHAFSLLTTTGPRGWVQMMTKTGASMTTEAWDAAVKPNQDWNHAWGAAPANIIPRFIMGIEPIEPGYRKVRIQPHPAGLAYAAITVPTIRGPINAAFDVQAGSFSLELDQPGNMNADVWLPWKAPGNVTVAVNGRESNFNRQGAYVVVPDLPPGKHVFVVTS